MKYIALDSLDGSHLADFFVSSEENNLSLKALEAQSYTADRFRIFFILKQIKWVKYNLDSGRE